MIYGITNGMVMQRGEDNTCEIWVTSDELLTEVFTDDGQTARVEMIDGRYKILRRTVFFKCERSYS